MKQFYYVVAFLLFTVNSGFSQTMDLGSWNIVNLKYNVDEKWSLFGEAQLRSLKFYHNFHYYEYKGGFNYKFHRNASLTLGAGSYQTYKEGGDFVFPKNNAEFRLWPQVALFQAIGKLKIEQRYRTEFRFTSNGYRNRFRYRLGASYSFGQKKDTYQPFQIGVSNELFFTNKEPYFERNRLLFSLNVKTSKNTTLQIGYLHQFDYKINDETGRDFLVAGFYYEIFQDSAPKTAPDHHLNDN